MTLPEAAWAVTACTRKDFADGSGNEPSMVLVATSPWEKV